MTGRSTRTFGGVEYAPGSQFIVTGAGVRLSGYTAIRGGSRGWGQELKPGDRVTCRGAGYGAGADPGYGIEFTTPEAEAAGAFHCEIWPSAGGPFAFRPAPGTLMPADSKLAGAEATENLLGEIAGRLDDFGGLVLAWPVELSGHLASTLVRDEDGQAYLLMLRPVCQHSQGGQPATEAGHCAACAPPRLLVCDRCYEAAAGLEAECADGCRQVLDHEGLCLVAGLNECQLCGQPDRLHAVDRAELPAAGKDGEDRWWLSYGGGRKGPYPSEQAAWDAWQAAPRT